MATWELNCQSNPSSADDKELAPYLARQKSMREFFERALFVPKDQDNNGLYFLGATTGSGKNYTAEQVTADLIAGGWDESGCFNKCPGRRTLVFVVPGKDNRDNYVANVRQLLIGQGMDCEDATRMVFDLPRAGENILHWIEVTVARVLWVFAKFRAPLKQMTRALIASLSGHGVTLWRSPMTFWASLTQGDAWEVLSIVWPPA